MTKINLTIAGKQQTLTTQQARDLFDELSKIFGQPLVIERSHPVFIPNDYRPEPFPQPAPLPWGWPQVTCEQPPQFHS